MKFSFLFCAVLLVLPLAACSSKTEESQQKERSEAVYILVETGGSTLVQEQEAAKDAVFHLLQQLMELDQRRATRDIEVNIILSSLPNRIVFTSKIEQLRQNVAQLKALLEFNAQSFSDLVMSYNTIKTSIVLNRPASVSIYHIGSMINIPYSKEDEISVKVPQDIPELALPNIIEMTEVKALKFYRVHPDQTQKLQEYLEAHTILQLGFNGSLDFALLGAAQTQSALRDLL